MILMAQQNGAGPIVSLSLGLGSAPAAIADAPQAVFAEATDLIMILRGGMLYLLPYAYLTDALVTGIQAFPTSQLATLGQAILGALPTNPALVSTGQFWLNGGIPQQSD